MNFYNEVFGVDITATLYRLESRVYKYIAAFELAFINVEGEASNVPI